MKRNLPSIDISQVPPSRILLMFLLVHFLIFVLLPSFLWRNPPLDVIECLAWGHEWQWGYHKHPPLPAWLLEGSIQLFGRSHVIPYVVSQAAVGAALWFVWLLGKDLFGDPWKALAGAVFLEGVIYFTFTSPEFNHNVLQLPCWAILAFSVRRAAITGRLRWWVLTGATAAAAFYTKYTSALILFGLFFYIGWDPGARKELRKPGFYLAIVILAALMLPHIDYLVKSDYAPFRYARERAGQGLSIAGRVYSPVLFLAAQLLAASPMMLWVHLIRKRNKEAGVLLSDASEQRRFLISVGILPLLLLLIGSAVLGLKLRSMWGTPLLTFSGLLAVDLFRIPQKIIAGRLFFRLLLVLFMAEILIFTGIGMFHPQKRTSYPGAELAGKLEAAWKAETGSPLSYVGGDIWTAGNVAFHSSARPSVIIDGSLQISPWVSRSELLKKGMLVVWDTDGNRLSGIPPLSGEYPPPSETGSVSAGTLSLFRKKVITVGYAIIRPRAPQ